MTLLDFGIARHRKRGMLTSSSPNHMHGTIHYLAPERAREKSELSPSSDIFSLGCVFFECLTGKPPFTGEHISGILASILFDAPPTIDGPRFGVAPAVEALLSRMLAKSPSERPADGAALVAELLRIERLLGTPPTGERLQTPTLTSGEQRLVTIIIAEDIPESSGLAKDPTTETAMGTLALNELLAPWGAQIERLASGTLIISLPYGATGEATDQAEQAARCTLLIKDRWPTARLVLTTGRERLAHRLHLGGAVDRAMHLLSKATASVVADAVVLDEVTAGLIEMVFDVPRIGEGLYALHTDSERLDRTRLLVGKPTPCVGREQDLALLESALSASVEESMAAMILISAPPGYGKSRLRHEFLRRLSTRTQQAQVLLGRADLMSVGSPYHMLAHALRGLCGIRSSEEPAIQHDKLLQHVRLYVEASEVARVSAFLAELCGVPFPEEACPLLAGARQNPRTMGAQVSRAWVHLLSAMSQQQPVLVVLEDIHWSDALSVALMQAVLHELCDRPLLILALGRPEMEELFPTLTRENRVQLLRLGRLSKKASERLARHVLGSEASPELIAQIVLRANGSALYLEELIRAVTEDTRQVLPDTILAMLEARLMRLDAAQRRLLRAASVFGESFEHDGLRHLLGQQHTAEVLDRWLESLLTAELIERSGDMSGDTQPRFRFYHALLREAAYDLLTPDDRALGHRLAAQYLEGAGGGEPRVLAEHYQRGGREDLAANYYLLAAERALANSDLEAALQSASCGIGCGATGKLLGAMRAVELKAHFWRDAWPQALAAAPEALQLLPIGEEAWCRAAAILLPTSSLSGDLATFGSLAMALTAMEPTAEAREAYFQAASFLLVMTSLLGQLDLSNVLLARLRSGLNSPGCGLIEQGFLKFGELVYMRSLHSDPWQNYLLAEEGARITEQAGDLRTLLFVKGFLGATLAELGDFAAAETTLKSCLELSSSLREPLLDTHIRVQHELSLLIAGDPARLAETLDSALRTVSNASINPLLRGEALTNLAAALRRSGKHAEAVAAAREACQLLAAVPPEHLLACTVLIRSLAELPAAHAEMRQLIAESYARIGSDRGGYGTILFLGFSGHSLILSGDAAAGRLLLDEALEELERRSQCIADPHLRERYLYGLPAHRLIFELAQRSHYPST